MSEYIITIIGTAIIYIFLILGLLIFGKKELTQLSITDLVFILLISNSVQNAMVNGDWKSLNMGMIAAATLFIMNYGLKRLVFKNAFFRNLIEGAPVILISDGIINQKNLEREEISLNELDAAIRAHGVENPTEVRLAVREANGNISIISYDSAKKTILPRKKMRVPEELKR